MSRPTFAIACVVLFGCSEPVPPAGEGAFYVQWIQSSSNSEFSCMVAGHEKEVGAVDVEALLQPALLKDTVGGASVFCSVVGSGSFRVEASISDGPITELSVLVDDMSPSATEDAPAFGSVTYRDAETTRVYSSPPDVPCAFYLERTNHEVASGRLWAHFVCERIEDPGSQSSCMIGSVNNPARIAIQNCEQ